MLFRSRSIDYDIPTLSDESDAEPPGGVTLRAGEMLRINETRALIKDLRLTTSTLESPDVELRFKRADYQMLSGDDGETGDTAPAHLSAWHLTFHFMGLPILYFPWIGYDLSSPQWFLKGRATNSSRDGLTAQGVVGWRLSKRERAAQCNDNHLTAVYVSGDVRAAVRGLGGSLRTSQLAFF